MRTITALYDSRQDAEAARTELTATGFEASAIQIIAADQDTGGSASPAAADGGEPRGFFAALKDFFMPDADRHAYSEGVRRGGYLLSARVDEDHADEVCRILEDSKAVDFDSRQAQWLFEGWKPGAWHDEGGHNPSEGVAAAGEEPRIGRREVGRGGVRVRSYVQETPAEAGLREAPVQIERAAPHRPVTAADGDTLFQDRPRPRTEPASFADEDRYAANAMQGEGGSSRGETEDERRERMLRERRPPPSI